MPAPTYRGRFAPSPTGPLHAGSLLAALGSWLLARQAGGAWLLRIEDVDPPREVVGAADGQIAALAAFGMRHDGPIEYQSRRHALYQAALDRLLAAGLAFECHCSRSDLAASGGIHRRCVAASTRTDPAIRLRVDDDCEVAFDDLIHGRVAQRVDVDAGDFVLRRADGLWAYQLAVVVDDAAQGITDVVRGADLLDSSPRQILLQRALGFRRRATPTCRCCWAMTAASCRSPATPGRSIPPTRCLPCTRPGMHSASTHWRWMPLRPTQSSPPRPMHSASNEYRAPRCRHPPQRTTTPQHHPARIIAIIPSLPGASP